MKVQLKEEYVNCKIIVTTQFNRKVKIDTSREDVMLFADVEAFKFMFEPVETKKKKKTKEPLIEAVENDGEFFEADTAQNEGPQEETNDLESMSLKELRNKFPDISARSKKEFIKELLESK